MQFFSARLLAARRRQILTQQELADAAGVSLRSIQMWENGVKALPRPASLRKLCAVLKVSPAYLAGKEVGSPDGTAKSVSSPLPTWLEPLCAQLEAMDEVRRQRMLSVLEGVVAVAQSSATQLTASVAESSKRSERRAEIRSGDDPV